jgi:hypothetical protein
VNVFPITNAGGDDAFVAKIDPALSGAASLLNSGYLGGDGMDIAYGIALDSSGNAYVAGSTSSANFPMLNEYQSVHDGGNNDAFVAMFARDSIISGTVSDDLSSPLQNVSVIVPNSGWGALTDEFGYYEINGLPPGCFEVVANPPSGYVISPTKNTYVGPGDEAVIDFALVPSALTISGDVGLDGVEVNYWNSTLDNGQYYTTHSGGYYLLDNLPLGKGELQVRPWGTDRAFTGKQVNLTGNLTGQDFNLVPEACISGQVVDENGNYISGVQVDYGNELHATGLNVYTGWNGYYSICNLPPGIGRIDVEPHSDTGFCGTSDRFIYLNEGENKGAGLMEVQAGALVLGAAKDPVGEGLSGLEIRSSGIDFESDDDTCNGAFQLRLTEGTHRIYLDTDGDGPYQFVASPVEVTITSGDVDSGVPVNAPDLTVYSESDPEASTLTGNVIDSVGTSSPIGELTIVVIPEGIVGSATPETFAGIGDIQETILEDFGPFTMTPVPPGSYDVVCILDNETPNGLTSFTLLGNQNVTISEGETIALSNFVYSAQGSPQVFGNVNDENGNSALGAWVLITDNSGDLVAFAQTDENGDYVVYNLPAGTYNVQASHPQYGDRPGTSITPTDGNDTPVPDITFTSPSGQFSLVGTVMNIHQPDGSRTTNLSVEPGNDFPGTLPDDVDSITITGPSGVLPYNKADFDFDPEFGGGFYLSIPRSPELGEYTFTVVAGPYVGTATDSQTVIRTISIPDIKAPSPADGATVQSKTPGFSWSAVDSLGIPIYYRLQIRDIVADERAFATDRTRDLLSYTVPLNELTPGKQYKWRIRATDADNWVGVQNRSHTEWRTFTMADPLSHSAVPAIDLYGWGVVTYTKTTGTNLDNCVKVIDHDGVSSDGSSHNATVSFPNGGPTYQMGFSDSISTIEGEYCYWHNLQGQPANPGDYTFTVTDPDGNPATFIDNLVVNLLEPPDETSFTIDVPDTTPMFTWDPVDGAQRYRVRIYSGDLSRTIWRGYTGNETFYRVPPGVLAPNTQYRYRIDAYEAHSSFENDNVSRAPADSDDFIEFWTGPLSEDPYIEVDSTGVETWNGKDFGAHPTFWIEVYDAQGVPGDIKSVKVTFPGGSEDVLYYDVGNRYNTSTSGIYLSDSFLPIETGTYTFTVEDREGHIYPVTEELNPDPIGYPSTTTFLPVHNAVINDTAVNFDWEDVGGAAFYRVEIYDTDYNRIYTFPTTVSNYQLPAGFLEENTLYRYRITTRREFFDENVDNGSSSPWLRSNRFTFMTHSITGGSSDPSIDLDNYGVAVVHTVNPTNGAPSYWLDFWVKVTDDDGVPGNIASVTVTYPGGSETRELRYHNKISSTQAYYGFSEIFDDLSLIQNGTYTFTVTDFGGGTDTLGDPLVKNILPVPANYTPGQDSKVIETRPTIDWDDVSGASSYRVRIYDGWNGTLHWSDFLTQSTYTVPAGVLTQIDPTYSYRIYAYREPYPNEDLDNFSINQIFNSERPHFTIGIGEDSDDDGLEDDWEETHFGDLSHDGTVDSDGDGLNDLQEYLKNTDPNNRDSDGDTVEDNDDKFPLNPDEWADNDGDGIGDNTDPDDDNDGVPDITDPCPNDPENDFDGDGFCGNDDNCPYVGNPSQEDPDVDGVGTACDNCPDAYNPGQEETDIPPEGGGDACNDYDDDGYEDAVDNCLDVPNGLQEDNQADLDNDGIGDACDDSDYDGVPDITDPCPFDPQDDVDGDGVCAGPSEICGDLGDICGPVDTCPGTPAGEPVDENGCSDSQLASTIQLEKPACTGKDCKVEDQVDDSDQDGKPDAEEPENCVGAPDCDLDGINDGADLCIEFSIYSDTYTPPGSNNHIDTDDDGLGDACDPDSDNDGICDDAGALPNGTPGTPSGGCIAGPDNCFQAANLDQADQDCDGKGDLCDPDQDGDGLDIAAETELGTDPTNPDSDNDDKPDGPGPYSYCTPGTIDWGYGQDEFPTGEPSYSLVLEVYDGAENITGRWLPKPHQFGDTVVTLPTPDYIDGPVLSLPPWVERGQIMIVATLKDPNGDTQQLEAPVSFTLDPSTLEGVAINDKEAYTTMPSNDFSFDPGDTNDVNKTVNPAGGKASVDLYAFDYGGWARIIATTDLDGLEVTGEFIFPLDSDDDNLPDIWEEFHSSAGFDKFKAKSFSFPNREANFDGNEDIDKSLDNTYDGDGIINSNEYRGVFFDDINGDFVSHMRLNPMMKDLFIRGDNFKNSLPPSNAANVLDFSVIVPGGSAFEEAHIAVHDVTRMFSFQGPTEAEEPPNIDILVVTNVTHTTQNELRDDDGFINHYSTRNWSWDYKGASYVGQWNAYSFDPALNKRGTFTYHLNLMHYVFNRPYRDEDPTENPIYNEALNLNYVGFLDPAELVEDYYMENGIGPQKLRGKNENRYRTEQKAVLDGDHMMTNWIIHKYGGEDYQAGYNFSVFDSDGDGFVENPPLADALTLTITKEYTLDELQTHTIIHEAGHGAGILNHTNDPTCVMNNDSINWDRAGHFSDDARHQILIHNKTEY